MEHGLLDEVRLLIYPVVLGGGMRLFGESPDKLPLRLVDSQTFGGGVVLLSYVPTGRDLVEFITFARLSW